MQIDFQEVFNDMVADDQKEWKHDRSLTLGASEVFDCLRKQWFSKIGDYPRDNSYKDDWGAMRRGDIIENNHFVPALEGYLPGNSEVIMHGEDQDTLVKGRNSATPDGLVINADKDALAKYGVPDIKSNCFMVECKSIDPRAVLKSEKEIHRGQVQVQMGLVRDNTEYKPQFSLIIYIDASFLSKMSIFVVEFEKGVYRSAQLRAEKMFEAKDAIELQPEGKFSGGCQYCPFKASCALVSNDSIPDPTAKPILDALDVVEMDGIVRDYQAIMSDKKKIERELAESQESVREILREKGSSRMVSDDWKVSWSKVKGRKSLDKKKMEEDGIDLDHYEKEGSPYDRLTITFTD